MRRALALLLLAAMLDGPAAAQPVPAEVAVRVVVGTREIPLDGAAFARLPVIEQEVTFASGSGPFRAVFRGVALWSALEAAGVLEGMDGRQRIRRVLRITGRDGHEVAVALAEIDPEYGNNPVLLAWAVDGRPLADGGLRLALPGDSRGGRNVRDVATVALE